MNRPMIADLHHFVEEQNADPGPHSIKVNSRIRIYVKRGNRIWNRIVVFRIRNTDYRYHKSGIGGKGHRFTENMRGY